MFYSHEVLTSRKYGVATIWLVATLGSKCGLKKVNRKAIFDVDVPKACGSIMQPDAPMALRLQSNLLYGVSKVYSQQCNYILVDAQNAYHNLKQMLRGIRVTDLEVMSSTARPDLLELADDPAFTPGLAYLPIDFDLMEVHLQTSQPRTPSLNSISSQFNIHNLGEGSQPLPGLVIPPDSSDGGGDVGFQGYSDDGPSSMRPAEPSSVQRHVAELGDAGFGFDEHGNMIDTDVPNEASHAQQAQLGAAAAANLGAVQEKEADQQENDQLPGLMDVDLPPLGEDTELPDAEPFSPAVPVETTAATAPAALDTDQQSHESSPQNGEVQSSSPSTAKAPMRRKKRGRKALGEDRPSELQNTDLRNWNDNYVQHMAAAKRMIAQHKLTAIGKRNAEWMVLGRGIADVGYGIGRHCVKSPLDMFCGDSLWEMVTGKKRDGSDARKRSLEIDDDDDENDSEGRRVRQRSEDGELRRAAEAQLEDDGALPPIGDDDIEMPREDVAGLDEHPSAMPWNITASIRGSSVTHGREHSQPPVPASASRSVAAYPGATARSRVVSASPLEGRGTAAPPPPGDDFSDGYGGGDGFPSSDDASIAPLDFSRFDPTDSQRIRDALNKEGHNFLGFIEHGLAEKRRRIAEAEEGGAETGESADEVVFEDLLPPGENTRMVAAQAFLHVLALATKNLITVRQEGHYAEIGMRVVDVEVDAE